MVKHNNQIPNIHCNKKYCESSRGPLKVRLSLDQASRKKTRRLARAKKAAALAPRPLQKLRPIVHCPTQRYSHKVRLGRGFTLEEVRAAGMTPAYARTVGIAVDHRRSNRCTESLDRNVARLAEYKKNLVVFKKKDTPMEEVAQLKGTILPLVKAKPEIVTQEITAEMKDYKAYTTGRVAASETRVAGYRISVINRKKKE